MPQPPPSLRPVSRSKRSATSTGSGAPPEEIRVSDGKVARLDARVVGERDPHCRHARKRGRALDLDVGERRLDVEARAQQDLVAELDAAAAGSW